jgi:hypothetical protein
MIRHPEKSQQSSRAIADCTCVCFAAQCRVTCSDDVVCCAGCLQKCASDCACCGLVLDTDLGECESCLQTGCMQTVSMPPTSSTDVWHVGVRSFCTSAACCSAAECGCGVQAHALVNSWCDVWHWSIDCLSTCLLLCIDASDASRTSATAHACLLEQVVFKVGCTGGLVADFRPLRPCCYGHRACETA